MGAHSAGDVLQHLRHRANAVIGHGVQNVEWGLGINEQRGWNQVDSGEGHVSIHFDGLCLIGLGRHSVVAKRLGGSCAQVGDPATEKPADPKVSRAQPP